MTQNQTSRRSVLGTLTGCIVGWCSVMTGAALAAMGGRAKADDLKVIEAAATRLKPIKTLITSRVREELDRLHKALLDPTTPPDRWLQCYAAQQALVWGLNPQMAMSPCKTIAEGRVQLAMSWHLPPVQANPLPIPTDAIKVAEQT